MGGKTDEYTLTRDNHLDILRQVTNTSTPEDLLLRSYGKSFNGFSATLTDKQSQHIKNIKGVVSVFPSKTLETQTTRAWDFLGLPQPNIFQPQSIESNVVIGVFDSGIWPESPSFDDKGLGPIPSTWKGVCKGGLNFTCNKKIIGARTYFSDAFDYTGHGTHSASIIAGKPVKNTSFYSLGNGISRGGVPSARIAVYKVCDSSKCPETNILAAFDDAINDGVDLISVSLGGPPRVPYQDVVAIGSFHGIQKGILTVQSVGNSKTVGSVSPWILSVAASSMDRRIVTRLVLGDGSTVTGASVNAFTMEKDKYYPLVHPNITMTIHPTPVWDEIPVKGKIVMLESIRYINFFMGVEVAGIVALTDDDEAAYVVPGPVVIAEARILPSETVRDTSVPIVASFSSRGPNQVASDILKPDITAPGVDIIAAYSPLANVTTFNGDKRRVNYTFLSGTSVACPVVAGAAAYVKSHHPDWSLSAITSALMTTSHAMSVSDNKEAEFAYGAGHLNPTAAITPGLVYETTPTEYITLMCRLNYTKDQINTILKNETFTNCPQQTPGSKFTPTDVNYPAMLTRLRLSDAIAPFSVDFQRTVTNVGSAQSVYTAKVELGNDVIKVMVKPDSLSFNSLKEKKSFTVTVSGDGLLDGVLYSAAVVWSDGVHSVRSPVGVYT